MIVEIGTSDFRTLAGKVQGLFIEPVKEYFDRLPECTKENVAVSNYEGDIDIWYIPSHIIQENNLPNWVRGCNSVENIHPTIVKNNWSHLAVCQEVKVVRIKSLLDKYGITEIDILKVDTEGHDCVIVNDFLDTCEIKPNVIQFESNVLSNSKDVENLCKRLIKLGYKCEQIKFDMICKL